MVDWAKIGGGILDFLDQSDEVAAAEQAAYNRAKIARDAAAKLAKDQSQEPGRRLAAAKQVEVYQQRIDTNPMIMRQKAEKFYTKQEERKLAKQLEKQGLLAPAGSTGAPAAPKLVVASAAPTAAAAPAAAPKLDGIYAGVDPEVAAFAQGIPGIPTSGFRTPAQNAALAARGYNPSPTSGHMAGLAVDVDIKDKKQGEALALQARQAGFLDSYYDKQRGHLHIGKERSQHGVARSMVPAAPGAIDTGGVAVHSPAMLAGMLRAPQMLPGVDLPAAPQQEMPAEMQPYVGFDREQIMADYAKAIEPVAPQNVAARPWDRIQSMLVGAGAAAAGADPAQGLGQFILRAGTGGAQGFQAERDQQRNEDKAYAEAQRQARIALEARGFLLKGKEIDLQNFNMDRVTTNENNKKAVKFSNMVAKDQRAVQEILQDYQATVSNIQMGNDFRRTQDQVMIGGYKDNTQAINAATANQVQANAIATKSGGSANLEQEIDTELTSIGLDTRNTRDPKLLTARSTLLGIKAGRPDAAVSAFAQELVMTPGAVQTILAPVKGGDPESEMVKAKALKEYARAKKPEEAWGTVQALNALMQNNPEAALQIAKDYQGQSPSAALILKHMKSSAPAQAAPAGGQ